MKTGKIRLDRLLVDRGLAETQQQAGGIILSGHVSVDGILTDKAGKLVAGDAEIQVKSPMPYVSRGGLKSATSGKAGGLLFAGPSKGPDRKHESQIPNTFQSM
ncbi:MAG: hypothetical protein HZA18_03265 [Nitrospirae bacterium]|nr:hypothetical protein [Nitrospirota bacterium]